MELIEFRISNFRSIIDTGWRKFSSDNVTVLVGQNESGKSSVLEALSKTLSTVEIENDDLRYAEPEPTISIKIKVSRNEIKKIMPGLDPLYWQAVEDHLDKNRDIFIYSFEWEKNSSNKFEGIYILAEPLLEAAWVEITNRIKNAQATKAVASSSEGHDISAKEALDAERKITEFSTLEDTVYDATPDIMLFNQEAGILPNTIDVKSDFTLSGDGAAAAYNYLLAAGLNLQELVTGDSRARENHLSRANTALTNDFAAFWSQTIGKISKLQLKCSVETYGSEAGDKSGQKYLTFWINNGLARLYPKQRSLGVRWFVSFYLQLRASEKNSVKRIFLLDEPGANLHSKAQADVLKLINKLSKDVPIIYSTHSPSMIEYDKLYRVLAVQRTGEDEEDSPTEIVPAHELGTASQDTLSPILSAMGVDLSHQEVIKKDNNILLEEMSGYYYLKAFWEMTNQQQAANFIAATGTSKLPTLANMFRGWGLNFIVVTDDDSSGRAVFNILKKDLFGDVDTDARKYMYKIAGCSGIEDVFSKNDFKRWVIVDDAEFEVKNSDRVKSNYSKPVLAYQFLLKVRNGDFSFENFDAVTQAKIQDLIQEITSRLQ